jgi:hypothetical protein
MRPEIFEGNENDFRERIIWVIKNLAGKPTRYRYLEERFGISARKWQNVCNKAQQPSIEMVAALAGIYPFFISWMITGESKTLTQLDPKDDMWFRKLLDSLEEKDAKVVLHMYADALYEETTGLKAIGNEGLKESDDNQEK